MRIENCNCPSCREDTLSASTRAIHKTKFESDCDVQILCTLEWVSPSSKKIDTEVLLSEVGLMYTSEKERVDCKVCLEKMKTK